MFHPSVCRNMLDCQLIGLKHLYISEKKKPFEALRCLYFKYNKTMK